LRFGLMRQRPLLAIAPSTIERRPQYPARGHGAFAHV
jgi:hypothetical protein